MLHGPNDQVTSLSFCIDRVKVQANWLLYATTTICETSC